MAAAAASCCGPTSCLRCLGLIPRFIWLGVFSLAKSLPLLLLNSFASDLTCEELPREEGIDPDPDTDTDPDAKADNDLSEEPGFTDDEAPSSTLVLFKRGMRFLAFSLGYFFSSSMPM